MGEQIRPHAGHSHGHSHDNTYLVSANKNDAGVRITRIGLLVNLLMAIGKGIGGYVFHSQALAADAVHSLTDLVSDFMTLATVSWALKPPTSRFPLGFGKIESLGSLGVSGLLLVGGVLMGWSALLDLCTIYLPNVAHVAEQIGLIGCGHNHSHSIPSMHAAWLAGGSVLVKEWLYHATMKVAVARKSAVLKSNAMHHRVDSLTGIAALISIVVSNLVPTFAGMDALGGLAISFMVVRAGWGNTLVSLEELADATVGDDIKGKARKAADSALEDGAVVRSVGGTKAGQNYLLEITVAVKEGMDVRSMVAVEKKVRERVGEKVRGARRIKVRFVPVEADESELSEFVWAQESRSGTPVEEEDDHHHHHNGMNGKNKVS